MSRASTFGTKRPRVRIAPSRPNPRPLSSTGLEHSTDNREMLVQIRQRLPTSLNFNLNHQRRSTMSPHILALDVAGAPHRWINVRDAAHYYATDMIAWAIGMHEFVLRGGTQRATGLQSMIRASSIIAIKGKDFIVRHFDHEPTLTKAMLLARDR